MEEKNQKNFNEGKAWVGTVPHAKFLLKLFLKSLSRAAGETAVARRNERNSLKRRFLFAKLFLLALLRQKKKRYGRRFFKKKGRRGRRPLPVCAIFVILIVGRWLAAAVHKNHCVLRGRPLVAPTGLIVVLNYHR